MIRSDSFFCFLQEGMVVIAEACPPPDTGRGRGPTRSVGRGRSEAKRNGVLRNTTIPDSNKKESSYCNLVKIT